MVIARDGKDTLITVSAEAEDRVTTESIRLLTIDAAKITAADFLF